MKPHIMCLCLPSSSFQSLMVTFSLGPASNATSFGTKATDGHPLDSLPSSSYPSPPNVDKNSVKKSASCDLQHCKGRGNCIAEGKVTRCQCLSGYKGEFCQEEERQSHVGVILGVFCVIAALIVAGFIFTKRYRLQ